METLCFLCSESHDEGFGISLGKKSVRREKLKLNFIMVEGEKNVRKEESNMG